MQIPQSPRPNPVATSYAEPLLSHLQFWGVEGMSPDGFSGGWCGVKNFYSGMRQAWVLILSSGTLTKAPFH